MAIPELSEVEKAILAEGEQIKMLQMHAGWKRTRDVMGQWVEDAKLDIEECVSSDEKLRSNLTIRYQERIRFVKMLDGWMADVVNKRTEVIREIAEASGNTPTDAFDMAQNL